MFHGEHKPEMYSVSQQVGEIIRTHSDYGFIRQKNGPAIPHTRAILIPIQEVGNVDKDKGVGFTLLMVTDWSMVCSPAWVTALESLQMNKGQSWFYCRSRPRRFRATVKKV